MKTVHIFFYLVVAGFGYQNADKVADDEPIIEDYNCIKDDDEDSPHILKHEKSVYMYELMLNEDFDPRDSGHPWKRCNRILNEVPRQGRCGDCWAHITALTISQRICINSLKGLDPQDDPIQESLSPRHLSTCGLAKTSPMLNGCNGASLAEIARALDSIGIFTGTTSTERDNGCQPYILPRCIEGDYSAECDGLMPGQVLHSGTCQTVCDDATKYDNNPRAFQWRGSSLIGKTIREIQEEIKRGPIMAQIFTKDKNDAFRKYTGGIFKIDKKYYDKMKTDHYVSIIGFNTSSSEKKKHYWIISNTWGQRWGEGGFARIAMGSDMLRIESNPNSIIPKQRVAIPGRQVHIHHPHGAHHICHSLRHGKVCQGNLKVSGYNMQEVVFGCLDNTHLAYSFYKNNPHAYYHGNYSRTITERVRVPVICA